MKLIRKSRAFSTGDAMSVNEMNSWGSKLEAEATRSITQTMQNSQANKGMDIDKSIPKIDPKAMQPMNVQKSQSSISL